VLLEALPAYAGVIVEIRGRITNPFTEAQYRAVTILITDRLGTEIGRAQPDREGQYEVKVSGPQFIIIKALLEGYPEVLIQLDTKQYKESTTDRPENVVFGELRIQTYHQNITFREKGEAAPVQSLDEMLAGEDAKVVEAYHEARKQRETGDLGKAAKSLEKLVEKHPEFYIGQIDLGMILAAQLENDRAIDVFNRALKLRPEHSWGHIGLGLALNNKKDFKGAVPHLERAVAIETNSINAQYQLGFALFNLGETDRAIACLEHVVRLDPKFNGMAYKYLSSLYVKKSDTGSAVRALESYVAHFPDAPDRARVEEILKKLGRSVK
jgi:tetratricopeptide (TPR) repeat protein